MEMHTLLEQPPEMDFFRSKIYYYMGCLDDGEQFDIFDYLGDDMEVEISNEFYDLVIIYRSKQYKRHKKFKKI